MPKNNQLCLIPNIDFQCLPIFKELKEKFEVCVFFLMKLGCFLCLHRAHVIFPCMMKQIGYLRSIFFGLSEWYILELLPKPISEYSSFYSSIGPVSIILWLVYFLLKIIQESLQLALARCLGWAAVSYTKRWWVYPQSEHTPRMGAGDNHPCFCLSVSLSLSVSPSIR